MLRLAATATVLAAALTTWSLPAGAVTLTQDSPIGRLVQVVAASHACQIPMTDAQQMTLTTAGQGLQDKLKATDADLDALMAKFGDGIPPGGCDAYKAGFQRSFDAAIAGAR